MPLYTPPSYQLYSKLLAYSGMRLGDQSLVDRAWATFNANKTGVWPDAVTVGGSDVRPSSPRLP